MLHWCVKVLGAAFCFCETTKVVLCDSRVCSSPACEEQTDTANINNIDDQIVVSPETLVRNIVFIGRSRAGKSTLIKVLKLKIKIILQDQPILLIIMVIYMLSLL